MTWFTAAEGQPTTAHDTEVEAEAARALLGERAVIYPADVAETHEVAICGDDGGQVDKNYAAVVTSPEKEKTL